MAPSHEPEAGEQQSSKDKSPQKMEALTNGTQALALSARRRSLHPADERSARHPRDEAFTPAESRDASQAPSQIPPIDFDGLSWPS